MPDIAMCGNPDECPKAETCYRAHARPTPGRQSYMNCYKEGETCEYYWEREVSE